MTDLDALDTLHVKRGRLGLTTDFVVAIDDAWPAISAELRELRARLAELEEDAARSAIPPAGEGQ